MEIHNFPIKLDSFLKLAVGLTGGEAKFAIQTGRVMVNGSICTQRGRALVVGDYVEFVNERFEVEAGT